MSEENENTIAEEIIKYFKERIDSPFVPAFMVSWLTFNHDFFLFWIFGDAESKFERLKNWDFSGFLAGLLYSEHVYSFYYPFVLALFISILFTSFSFTVSALRYKISTFARAFALKEKSNFDEIDKKVKLQTDVGILENKLDEIGAAYANLTSAYDELSIKKVGLEQSIDQLTRMSSNSKHKQLFNLLATSILVNKQYSDHKSDYKLKRRGEIKENSLITFTLHGENFSKKYSNMPIAELFSISELCIPQNEEMFNFMYSVLVESNLTRRMINGREFQIDTIVNFELIQEETEHKVN